MWVWIQVIHCSFAWQSIKIRGESKKNCMEILHFWKAHAIGVLYICPTIYFVVNWREYKYFLLHSLFSLMVNACVLTQMDSIRYCWYFNSTLFRRDVEEMHLNHNHDEHQTRMSARWLKWTFSSSDMAFFVEEDLISTKLDVCSSDYFSCRYRSAFVLMVQNNAIIQTEITKQSLR